ncbi:ABC transporter permease [Desulfosarcina ovata subsp. sediminis]|uniref:ABC transporter permease n=1 Tax=Desulfosarcina ovata subsp. sediminis TaxID=885957 RepID=A0A5K7ZQE6_9BACT|nr:ABC transporter permease [Desulfosarcina ovata]BBO82489.1 ABC transporter permease [Desulfosarcina ovata subsp. sediminis]
MRKLTNIVFLGIKELRSFWHDKVLFIFVIWAFSGGIYAISTATSLELHKAPIAVLDEDRSQLSAQIIDAFYPPYFQTPIDIPPAAMNSGMDSGRFTFVLDIPPDFEHDLLAGEGPDVLVNIDATRMTQAFIGSGYIRRIINAEIADFLKATGDTGLPIRQTIRVKFNPNRNSTWFGSVMEIINNITMLSIILTGAALIREREHGTIEHLLVMPLTPLEIMAAKVWSNGLVVLVGAGLSLWLVVQKALGVPVAGSTSLFLLGAMLHLFSTTSIGIFLGTLARSMPQLGLLMILVLLPLQILSGGITPRESMPAVVQTIMQFAPTTHFVALAQAILYRGAGIAAVWTHLLAIIGIGVVFFSIALFRFRKSVTQTQL